MYISSLHLAHTHRFERTHCEKQCATVEGDEKKGGSFAINMRQRSYRMHRYPVIVTLFLASIQSQEMTIATTTTTTTTNKIDEEEYAENDLNKFMKLDEVNCRRKYH